MATNHSLQEILRIMEKDLNIYDDLTSKKIDKRNSEQEFGSVKSRMEKLKSLEKWLGIDPESKNTETKNEIENIKLDNAKMMTKTMENMMSKKILRPDGSHYNAYGHSSSRSHKYGVGRDSTIFNNQIFRLLIENLIEDRSIYNIILKESPLFPNEDIKINQSLNRHEDVYLVVTSQETNKILGCFNFTAYRMWIEHVGTESSYKKYPKTHIRIIKKSKTHYKIIVSKTRPSLEIRDDKTIQHSKENKL